MEKVKQTEIKNWSDNFYNDIINIQGVDSNLLKINKISYKAIDIYYIEYIVIKKDWWLWKYLRRNSFVSDKW